MRLWRSNSSSNTFDLVLTIGIIAVVGVLVFQLWTSYRSLKPSQLQVGSNVPLKDVSWNNYDQVLILAYSSTCPPCQDSAPTYKRLIALMKRPGTRTLTVALLPQPIHESKPYLERLGVVVDEIREVKFSAFGIKATPSLFVVGPTGTVTRSWTGTIAVSRQFELFEELGIDYINVLPTESSGPTLIDGAFLRSLMSRNDLSITILDARDREAYNASHFPNSVNIPLDEIQSRANDELSLSSSLIVFGEDERSTFAAADWLLNVCGFTRVAVLRDGASSLFSDPRGQPIINESH